MSHKQNEAPDGLEAHLLSQTGEIANQLSRYAQRRVRITVTTGGGQQTFDSGGNGPSCEIHLETQVLQRIRSNDQALRIWIGLALHQLGQILWPAQECYEIAATERLTMVFHLLDVEQNERRGTALSEDWGRSSRSATAFLEPKKQHVESSALEAGSQLYLERLHQFGFYLRRHLTGTQDPIVAEALEEVKNSGLMDLSKEQVLELAGRVNQFLTTGIHPSQWLEVAKTRVHPTKAVKESVVSAAVRDMPELPPPGSIKQWLLNFCHRHRNYLLLGLPSIGLASLLLAVFGATVWDKLFWLIVIAIPAAAILIGVCVIIEGLGHVLGQAVFGALDRFFDLFRRLSKISFSDWLTELLNYIFVDRPAALWRKARWLRMAWEGLCRVIAIAYHRFRDWIQEQWLNLERRAYSLWRRPTVRIATVCVLLAIWLAMAIAVPYVGFDEQPIYLLIMELVVFVGVTVVMIWKRKKFMALMMSGAYDVDLPDWLLVQESYHDRDNEEFQPIEAIMPVDADAQKLGELLDEEVEAAATWLHEQLEDCGFKAVDIDEMEEGENVGENASDALLGRLDFMENTEDEPKSSLHVAVALDCSVSQEQRTSTSVKGEKFRRGHRFATMLELALTNLEGVSSHFLGYTDVILDAGAAGSGRLSGLSATGEGNNDAAALHFMAQDSIENFSEASVKVLVIINDGKPSSCTWASSRAVARMLQMSEGFVVIQVAVDTISDPAVENNKIDLLGRSLLESAMEFLSITQAHLH